MMRSDEFTWGPSSDWTKIRPRNCIQRAAHGYSAETSHQARPEADSDAVAAAGHQAAADVDARVVGTPQPGNGGEPDARGGAHRRAPARRGRPGKAGRKTETGKGHLGRSGLRIFLRRLPG